jgi:glycosyltransferase involved in cell wall biosynthesis
VHIWLITIGEPLPIRGTQPRLLRTGIFANFLQEKGNTIVWWNSVFDHTNKIFWNPSDIETTEGIDIELLQGCGYQNNVSIKRFYDHHLLSIDFAKRIKEARKPDLILASYPTQGLCAVAVNYGKQHGIPVLLDVRDLWPDDFVELVPSFFKPLAKLVLRPWYWSVAKCFKGATGISAITEPILQWALDLAGRGQRKADFVVPLGYLRRTEASDHQSLHEQFPQLQEPVQIRICFFGALGRQIDLETVIDASKMLEAKGLSHQFVLAGAGDNMQNLQKLAIDVKSVLLTGFVDASMIQYIAKHSDIGIAPYRRNGSFQRSLPNKVFEYMAYELPVLTSLDGYLRSFLHEHQIGYTYDAKSAESLATTILALSTQREHLRLAGKLGNDLYEKQYSHHVVYENFMQHLINVKKQHPGTSL